MSKRKSQRRAQQRIHVRDEVREPYHIRDIPLSDTFRVQNVIEDRRTYHPRTSNRDYKTLAGRTAKFIDRVSEGSEKWGRAVGQIYFHSPLRVMVCKKRRKRRQSLFALRKAGKGIPGPKFRKLSEISKVRCK